jgi:ATP-dependent DNA helicase RecG
VTILKNQFNEKNLISKGLSTRQIKAIEYLKENKQITNKIYQEICEVSKATATRDLSELIEKFKILERSGDVGAGTTYKLIGS